MTFGFICIKNAKMPPETRMILLQKCNMWKGKNVAKGAILWAILLGQ